MNHIANSYQKVQVETTESPLKLVVMLYEGAINFLEQAKLRVADNQVGEKGILINKVIAIVSELQGSLNMTEGGEVAESLDRIYTYLISRLLEANANNDPAALDEILAHLRTLKAAWIQIADQKDSVAPSSKGREDSVNAIPSGGSADAQPVIELVG